MAYVMVIDDDEDYAAAAAKVLTGAGHETQVVLDTRNAIQLMEKRPPDLVILDVMFPEDSTAGFELARTMRQEKSKLKGVPVLLLTAVNERFPLGFSAKDIDDYWLPVADFVEKAVDFDVLLGKVTRLLAESKAGPSAAGKGCKECKA